MIRNPLALLACLAGLVVLVQWAKGRGPVQKAFRFLPVPFWCYFLPMAGSTLGVFPLESPLYPFLSRYALPLCLALLLLPVDVRSLAALGRPALAAMIAGMAGISLGAVASYSLFRPFLPAESWKAVGALSASWTGGSANMLALKEALAVPDPVFAPAVVVDTFFAYAWMALLVFLAGHQERFDRWNRAEPPAPGSGLRIENEDTGRTAGEKRLFGTAEFSAFAVCSVVAAFSLFAGDALPAVGSAVSHATWTVFLATTLSLACAWAFTRNMKPATRNFCERWGTAILYILLASLGARVRLSAIVEAPLFLAAGGLLLAVHGAVLFLAGRWMKAPLFLLATASQACVGGTVSAPLVAAVYRPAFAALGLLLAVLGNVAGTYIGFLTAQACRWVGP